MPCSTRAGAAAHGVEGKDGAREAQDLKRKRKAERDRNNSSKWRARQKEKAATLEGALLRLESATTHFITMTSDSEQTSTKQFLEQNWKGFEKILADMQSTEQAWRTKLLASKNEACTSPTESTQSCVPSQDSRTTHPHVNPSPASAGSISGIGRARQREFEELSARLTLLSNSYNTPPLRRTTF